MSSSIRYPSIRRSSIRVCGALVAVVALAGCGGGPSAPGEPTGSRLANLMAFGTTTPPPAPAAADPNALKMRSCPEVEINDGGSSLRVGGPASASVRHQFSIVDVARQCDQQGGQIAIKVGVEGNLVIGPAGSGGAQSATVRVSVRDEKTEKPIITKTYRVTATASGGGAAPFTLVTEPFVVPLKDEFASNDYALIVGFEGARPTATPSRRRGR